MQFDPEIYLKELRPDVRSGRIHSRGGTTKAVASRFAETTAQLHDALEGEAHEVLARVRRGQHTEREVEWFLQAFDGQLQRLSLLTERWAAKQTNRLVPGTDWQASFSEMQSRSDQTAVARLVMRELADMVALTGRMQETSGRPLPIFSVTAEELRAVRREYSEVTESDLAEAAASRPLAAVEEARSIGVTARGLKQLGLSDDRAHILAVQAPWARRWISGRYTSISQKRSDEALIKREIEKASEQRELGRSLRAVTPAELDRLLARTVSQVRVQRVKEFAGHPQASRYLAELRAFNERRLVTPRGRLLDHQEAEAAEVIEVVQRMRAPELAAFVREMIGRRLGEPEIKALTDGFGLQFRRLVATSVRLQEGQQIERSILDLSQRQHDVLSRMILLDLVEMAAISATTAASSIARLPTHILTPDRLRDLMSENPELTRGNIRDAIVKHPEAPVFTIQRTGAVIRNLVALGNAAPLAHALAIQRIDLALRVLDEEDELTMPVALDQLGERKTKAPSTSEAPAVEGRNDVLAFEALREVVRQEKVSVSDNEFAVRYLGRLRMLSTEHVFKRRHRLPHYGREAQARRLAVSESLRRQERLNGFFEIVRGQELASYEGSDIRLAYQDQIRRIMTNAGRLKAAGYLQKDLFDLDDEDLQAVLDLALLDFVDMARIGEIASGASLAKLPVPQTSSEEVERAWHDHGELTRSNVRLIMLRNRRVPQAIRRLGDAVRELAGLTDLETARAVASENGQQGLRLHTPGSRTNELYKRVVDPADPYSFEDMRRQLRGRRHERYRDSPIALVGAHRLDQGLLATAPPEPEFSARRYLADVRRGLRDRASSGERLRIGVGAEYHAAGFAEGAIEASSDRLPAMFGAALGGDMSEEELDAVRAGVQSRFRQLLLMTSEMRAKGRISRDLAELDETERDAVLTEFTYDIAALTAFTGRAEKSDLARLPVFVTGADEVIAEMRRAGVPVANVASAIRRYPSDPVARIRFEGGLIPELARHGVPATAASYVIDRSQMREVIERFRVSGGRVPGVTGRTGNAVETRAHLAEAVVLAERADVLEERARRMLREAELLETKRGDLRGAQIVRLSAARLQAQAEDLRDPEGAVARAEARSSEQAQRSASATLDRIQRVDAIRARGSPLQREGPGRRVPESVEQRGRDGGVEDSGIGLEIAIDNVGPGA